MTTKMRSEVVQSAQKIIFGNEGGYSSVNANDNGAVSVGKVQWHAGRALALLKKICAAESGAASILGTALYGEITTAASGAWKARTVNSAEKAAISKLLSTDTGKRVQDAQAETDVGAYVDHGLAVGVDAPAALVYFADMENQGGGGASARVAAAAQKPVTLDTIHAAGLADRVMGKYATRRKKVYEAAKKLKWSEEEKGGQNMSFTPRLTRPEAGNKYYITKAAGGYSDAVNGSPADSACNVLSNCVGYAYGRFNEIIGEGACKHLRPVNAENFIQYKGTLEVGMEPRLGACMVWQKGATLKGSDGAGHVAIVEKIVSSTEIVTSESGWGASKPFWTQTRKKGSGNWGQGSSYKFLGFIYNPAACCQGTVPSAPAAAEKPSATPTTEKKAKEAARSLNKALAGTYVVTADKGLHIRSGAGSGKSSLAVLPKGTKVRNYGYYTDLSGVAWLYVQVAYKGVTYTGFCSGQYLSKQ